MSYLWFLIQLGTMSKAILNQIIFTLKNITKIVVNSEILCFRWEICVVTIVPLGNLCILLFVWALSYIFTWYISLLTKIIIYRWSSNSQLLQQQRLIPPRPPKKYPDSLPLETPPWTQPPRGFRSRPITRRPQTPLMAKSLIIILTLKTLCSTSVIMKDEGCSSPAVAVNNTSGSQWIFILNM